MQWSGGAAAGRGSFCAGEWMSGGEVASVRRRRWLRGGAFL